MMEHQNPTVVLRKGGQRLIQHAFGAKWRIRGPQRVRFLRSGAEPGFTAREIGGLVNRRFLQPGGQAGDRGFPQLAGKHDEYLLRRVFREIGAFQPPPRHRQHQRQVAPHQLGERGIVRRIGETAHQLRVAFAGHGGILVGFPHVPTPSSDRRGNQTRPGEKVFRKVGLHEVICAPWQRQSPL